MHLAVPYVEAHLLQRVHPANALDRPFAVSSRSRWLIWLSCGIQSPGRWAASGGVVIRRLAEALSSSWSLRDNLRRQIVMNGGLVGSVSRAAGSGTR